MFTVRMDFKCPVTVSAFEESKQYGFQSVTILNDSGRRLQSIHLKALLSDDGSEGDEVDGGRFNVPLESGRRQQIDTWLAERRAILQKVTSMRKHEGIVLLVVASVEFADGSHWEKEGRTGELPINDPVKPNVQIPQRK
jgi:hypothetical protein